MPAVAVRVVDVYPYQVAPDGRLEFLLLRRSSASIYAGQWRMVGGKVREHETAWEAARRELIEETGLVPLVLWALPSVNTFYEWQNDTVNVVPAFAAAVAGEPVLNHEHDWYAWCTVDDALRLLVWPEQQRLIKLVAGMLTQGIPAELQIH